MGIVTVHPSNSSSRSQMRRRGPNRCASRGWAGPGSKARGRVLLLGTAAVADPAASGAGRRQAVGG